MTESNARELLNDAITLRGSLGAVARHTKLNESTLKRIKNGTSEKCHPKTLGLLLSAARKDTRKGLTAGKAPAPTPSNHQQKGLAMNDPKLNEIADENKAAAEATTDGMPEAPAAEDEQAEGQEQQDQVAVS